MRDEKIIYSIYNKAQPMYKNMNKEIKLTLLEIKYELEVLLKKRINITNDEFHKQVDGNYFVSTLMNEYDVKLSFIDMKKFNDDNFNHHLFEQVDEAMQTEDGAITKDDIGFKQGIKAITYYLNMNHPRLP
jgi:hypothetical protein